MSKVNLQTANGNAVLVSAPAKLEIVNVTKAGDSTTAFNLYDANVSSFQSVPAAPAGALAAGTNLGVGAYKYLVTFVTTLGETARGAELSITTTSNNQAVNLSTIPTGTAGTIARNIYRTAVGGATNTEKLLATINDNITTTYADTATDASITGNATSPAANTITAPNIFSLAGALTGCYLQGSDGDAGILVGNGIAFIMTSSTPPIVQTIWELN